jgi:hypothetical protein
MPFGLGAQVAQLVEHCTENAGVGGSIPPLGTISFPGASIVNLQPWRGTRLRGPRIGQEVSASRAFECYAVAGSTAAARNACMKGNEAF